MQVHWCWCVNFWRSTLLWGKILLSLFKSQVQFSLLDEKMQSFYIPPNPAIHSESRENVHFENSFNPSWCCISHHCAEITLIDKGVENSVEWCQCHCDKSVSLFLHPHAFLLLVAFPPPLFRDFFRLCHPRLRGTFPSWKRAQDIEHSMRGNQFFSPFFWDYERCKAMKMTWKIKFHYETARKEIWHSSKIVDCWPKWQLF